MDQRQDTNISIVQTTVADMQMILWLFDQAMQLQAKNGYRVWKTIDEAGLLRDIENGLQYKIMSGDAILCIFSIQLSDPFIWSERDKGDAVYLHRIVTNPNFKGQKQFLKILDWTKQFANSRNLKFIRMDTWADNSQLIAYYRSFGFEVIEEYQTPDAAELPVQNRNLSVTLLQLALDAGIN